MAKSFIDPRKSNIQTIKVEKNLFIYSLIFEWQIVIDMSKKSMIIFYINKHSLNFSLSLRVKGP